MKEKFTKADLKNLMVVEFRNGWKAVVIDDLLVGKDGYMNLAGYDNDLKHMKPCFDRPGGDRDWDIVKVWNKYRGMGSGFNTYIDEVNGDSTLIWGRKEKKEIKLTTEERAFLNSILLVSDYKYIARDKKCNALYVFRAKPNKGFFSCEWVYSPGDFHATDITDKTEGMFEFISWDDDEPYSIEDLLKL